MYQGGQRSVNYRETDWSPYQAISETLMSSRLREPVHYFLSEFVLDPLLLANEIIQRDPTTQQHQGQGLLLVFSLLSPALPFPAPNIHMRLLFSSKAVSKFWFDI